jgi:hypothetical protein
LTSYWKGTDAHTQKQLLHKEPLEPTETVGVNLPDVKINPWTQPKPVSSLSANIIETFENKTKNKGRNCILYAINLPIPAIQKTPHNAGFFKNTIIK